MHFIAFCHWLGLATAVGTSVSLNYIKFTGIDQGNGVSCWLGLPYATPPTGEFRFKAPVSPPSNPTAFQATTHKPICLSNTAAYDASSTYTAEDCLYADVYAPTSATVSSNLPVYVFLQGGGFNSNAHPNYNGTSLIEASGKNIVVVTFNYRVGVWGFLASKEVQAAGNANVGLLDQRFMLQWVQKYISHFGGNPNHVTIGGPSAGGASTNLHLTAYGGRNDGLFHAAAGESPSFGPQLSIAQAQYQYNNLVAKVGCSNSKNTLECLRGLDTGIIQGNQTNIAYPNQPGAAAPLYMWSNVIDGSFTQDYAYRMLAEGRFVSVPTIFGAVTNDGTIFAPQSTANTAQMNAFLQSNFPNLNSQMLSQIDSTYRQGQVYPKAQSYWPPLAQAYGEMRYRCPGIYISDAAAQQYEAPAWNYHYNVLATGAAGTGYGVTHTIETNAIWGPTSSSPSNYYSNSSFVHAMQGYWTSFIRSKNPNTYRYPGTVYWEQWQPYYQQSVIINNDNTAMEDYPSDLKQRCSFWRTVGVSLFQ